MEEKVENLEINQELVIGNEEVEDIEIEVSMEDETAVETPAERELENIETSEEKKELEIQKSELSEKTEEKEELKKGDMKEILSYLDSLFGYLPEDKIKEFAKSKYYDLYNKMFDDLGL